MTFMAKLQRASASMGLFGQFYFESGRCDPRFWIGRRVFGGFDGAGIGFALVGPTHSEIGY
jgi:hypothetical protein